jgi:hypothetical protein
LNQADAQDTVVLSERINRGVNGCAELSGIGLPARHTSRLPQGGGR